MLSGAGHNACHSRQQMQPSIITISASGVVCVDDTTSSLSPSCCCDSVVHLALPNYQTIRCFHDRTDGVLVRPHNFQEVYFPLLWCVWNGVLQFQFSLIHFFWSSPAQSLMVSSPVGTHDLIYVFRRSFSSTSLIRILYFNFNVLLTTMGIDKSLA
jgi:hypothetical protein